jgi:hypothetical protein
MAQTPDLRGATPVGPYPPNCDIVWRRVIGHQGRGPVRLASAIRRRAASRESRTAGDRICRCGISCFEGHVVGRGFAGHGFPGWRSQPLPPVRTGEGIGTNTGMGRMIMDCMTYLW